ncbi:uncharacterized protein VSU04_000766 [Chlamydotis macqueenii]
MKELSPTHPSKYGELNTRSICASDSQEAPVAGLASPRPLAAPRTPPEPPQAAPGRAPAPRGTHRLLTGALPGRSRRLRARHPVPPFAQRPLLSPSARPRSGYGALWSARSAGASGSRSCHSAAEAVGSAGPAARLPPRRQGAAAAAVSLPLCSAAALGGADSCRRRSLGPGGCFPSAPLYLPATPHAPGPARSPVSLPLSPPAVNTRWRQQQKFRPPTRKLIGSPGPRGSDGKRIRQAGGGSGAGPGRGGAERDASRSAGPWAAGTGRGCGEGGDGRHHRGRWSDPSKNTGLRAWESEDLYFS